MIKKIFFISILLLILVGSIYTFLCPVKCTNKCNDKNIFRYKFGVYTNNSNITNGLKFKKIGGLLEFLNFKKIKCESEILGEHYKEIKEKIMSYNKSLKWRKLNCGLWINKNNDIGFKTSRAFGEIEGKFIHEDYYLTKFGFNENPPLEDIIDTLTFHNLGNLYYKDKNYIYHFYSMIDGGSFYILDEADYETFEILGDCYARDKNHIYEFRKGKLDSIDYSTFKTKEGLTNCLAKDKFGYITYGERINNDEYLEEEYMQKGIKILENE